MTEKSGIFLWVCRRVVGNDASEIIQLIELIDFGNKFCRMKNTDWNTWHSSTVDKMLRTHESLLTLNNLGCFANPAISINTGVNTVFPIHWINYLFKNRKIFNNSIILALGGLKMIFTKRYIFQFILWALSTLAKLIPNACFFSKYSVNKS